MKDLKIKNESLSSSVYLSDNRKEAKLHFWLSWSENASLIFNTEDKDNIHPIRIEAETIENNVGTKINIEVASNGFIIKVGADLKIASSNYDMRNILNDIIITETEHSFSYLENVHTFENIEDAVEAIKEELNR